MYLAALVFFSRLVEVSVDPRFLLQSLVSYDRRTFLPFDLSSSPPFSTDFNLTLVNAIEADSCCFFPSEFGINITSSLSLYRINVDYHASRAS